jgi:hypothetical protein
MKVDKCALVNWGRGKVVDRLSKTAQQRSMFSTCFPKQSSHCTMPLVVMLTLPVLVGELCQCLRPMYACTDHHASNIAAVVAYMV